MKKLAGLANNLSAMVVSEGAGELFEELMDLPDGEIIIDLIRAHGYLNNSIVLTTPYLKKISTWFINRVPDCGIDTKDISVASVVVNIDGSTVPCDRTSIVHYVASATTTIEVKGRQYKGSAPATHVWHKRRT